MKAAKPKQEQDDFIIIKPGDGHSRRVLVADDDVHMRHTLTRYLDPFAQVDGAANGVEAIQAFASARQEHPYDLIFLDLIMPIMDGIEALRIIRSLERQWSVLDSATCPVVVVTSANDPELIQELFQANAIADHVTKPFTREKIHDLAARFLAENSDESLAAAEWLVEIERRKFLREKAKNFFGKKEKALHPCT